MRILEGKITLRGGWRIYSAALVFLQGYFDAFSWHKEGLGTIHIDPVLPCRHLTAEGHGVIAGADHAHIPCREGSAVPNGL